MTSSPRDVAERIVGEWDDDAAMMESVSRPRLDALIARITAALTIPPGHVRDEHGELIKVLGDGLARLASGEAVGKNGVFWFPGRNRTRRTPDATTQLEAAASAKERGAFRDLLAFMGENKKWWLLPIIIVLALIGALLILASTGAAPFIYPLF